MRLVLFVKAKRAAIGAKSPDGTRVKVAEGKWAPVKKESTGRAKLRVLIDRYTAAERKSDAQTYDTGEHTRGGNSAQTAAATRAFRKLQSAYQEAYPEDTLFEGLHQMLRDYDANMEKAKRAPIGATSQDGKRKKVAEGRWVPIPKGGGGSIGSGDAFKIGSIKYDTRSCSRCAGSGQHSYNSFTGETKCYKCGGSGTQLTKQAEKAREAVVAERKAVMEVSPNDVKVGDAIHSGGKWRRVTEVRILFNGDLVDFRIGKGDNWHGFGPRDKVMRYTPWPKASVDKISSLSGVTISWEPVEPLSKAKRAAIGATSQDGKRKKVAEGKWVPIKESSDDIRLRETEDFVKKLFGQDEESIKTAALEKKTKRAELKKKIASRKKRIDDLSERAKSYKRGPLIYTDQYGDGFGKHKRAGDINRERAYREMDLLSREIRTYEGELSGLSKAKRAPIGSTSQDGKRKKMAEGRWVPIPKGKSPPKRISDKATVPPTWTDVEYFSGDSDKLLLRGKDAKGRLQYVYNPKYLSASSKEKFARINALNKVYDNIVDENTTNANAGSVEAECLALIIDTGIRPGSEKDTMAEVEAFAATTLLGKHVVVSEDSVRLEFIGKKGVSQSLTVTSPQVRESLIRRKGKVADDSRIFPTTGDRLLLYTKSLGSGAGFQSKDFRTHLGTATAMAAMKGRRYPITEKEYKKAVAEVADAVASKLGNTRKVALSSYINPAVFEKWRRRIEQS